MNKDKKRNQYIEEYRYRVGYAINETPRYRSLVGVDEVFDEIPDFKNEAGDQEEAPKPGGGRTPHEPSLDQPDTSGDNLQGDKPVVPEPPIPAFDSPSDGNPEPTDPNVTDSVDGIQNDIIKHNIEALKSIHDQLTLLNNTTNDLNIKFEELAANVEEVREPSNVEKLMSKSDVSYPYYFNLNDVWSDNWFNRQREAEGSKGINKLDDDTYVADFDNLPKKSKTDIINSFNEIG